MTTKMADRQSEEVAQAEGQSDAHRESTPQTETEAPTEAEGVTEATDVPAGGDAEPAPPDMEDPEIGQEPSKGTEGSDAPLGEAGEDATAEDDGSAPAEEAVAEPSPDGEGVMEAAAGEANQTSVEGEQPLPDDTEVQPKPEGEGDPLTEGEAPKESAEDGPATEGEQALHTETEGDGAAEPFETTDTMGEAAPAVEEDGSPREEGALVVGEQLSRDGTPRGEQEDIRIESPPVPGTPDRGNRDVLHEDSMEDGNMAPAQKQAIVKEGTGSLKEGDEEGMDEMEEEEEEPQPEFDREQLIERYHQALADREQMLQQNFQLQHRLAEHFRKKKTEETRQEVDKNVTDSEQRYVKYMAQLEDLRRQDADERDTYKLQIEDLKDKCQEKQMRVEEEQTKFMEFQKQVALNSLNSRSGKIIPPKDIEQYLAVENRKEAEVVNVRLENIKLKNKLRKKEQQLKSKEELAEGLHLIDFEQLKIENQTYNEKIEERNEDLLKLRKKITSTVQVLTHLKEKLQFVYAENQVLKGHLYEVEVEAARKRDKLTRTKQARDHLRIDNHRLRQNCGLLGNEPLLRDFEERKDESGDLRDKLETLKMQHAELTLSCSGVRKKIEQARQGRV